LGFVSKEHTLANDIGLIAQ